MSELFCFASREDFIFTYDSASALGRSQEHGQSLFVTVHSVHMLLQFDLEFRL